MSQAERDALGLSDRGTLGNAWGDYQSYLKSKGKPTTNGASGVAVSSPDLLYGLSSYMQLPTNVTPALPAASAAAPFAFPGQSIGDLIWRG